MEKLFTYGSLQKPDIQIKLFHRTLEGKEDVLHGYEKGIFAIEQKKFNILIPRVGNDIEGTVYDLTMDELLRADRYEGKDYRRIRVKLASGAVAWLYMRT